jgi:hypothetical protein
LSNLSPSKSDAVSTAISPEKVREEAWAIINKLIDPTRKIIFCDRKRVEAVIADSLGKLLGDHKPAKGTIAQIANDCARQMLGPKPNRCITNQPRAHAIVQDGINYALGERKSPYEVSEGRVRAGRKGLSAILTAAGRGKDGRTGHLPTQIDPRPIPHLPTTPPSDNED